MKENNMVSLEKHNTLKSFFDECNNSKDSVSLEEENDSSIHNEFDRTENNVVNLTISQEGFFSEIKRRWRLRIKKRQIPADWFKHVYNDWTNYHKTQLHVLTDPNSFESQHHFIQKVNNRYPSEKNEQSDPDYFQGVLDDLQFLRNIILKNKEKTLYQKTQNLCYKKIQELGQNSSDFKHFSLYGIYHDAYTLLMQNDDNIKALLKYLKAKKQNSAIMAKFYAKMSIGLCTLIIELQNMIFYYEYELENCKDHDANKTYFGIPYNYGMWSTLNAFYYDYILLEFVDRTVQGGISHLIRRLYTFETRAKESLFLSFVSILGIMIIARLSISLARFITYNLKSGRVDTYNDMLRNIDMLSINIAELKERIETTTDFKEQERLQSIISKQEKIRDKINKKIDKRYQDLKREHYILSQEVEEDFDNIEKEIKEYPQQEQQGEIIL